jgi:hypothetical protein
MLLKMKELWLRGVDLNHRPLGYEFDNIRIFKELRGVIGSSTERQGRVRNSCCGGIVGVNEMRRMKRAGASGSHV